MESNIKAKYTDRDLENLEFHDSKIVAQFYDEVNHEFYLDLDYITKWIQQEHKFLFEITPATLVFKEVQYLKFEQDGVDSNFGPTINLIEQKKLIKNNIEYLIFTIDCHYGYFEMCASGFELYLRRVPSSCDYQSIAQRGGVSFSKEAFIRDGKQ